VSGVRRLPGGGLRLTLGVNEVAALSALPDQLRPIVDGAAGGEAAEAVRARLFPPAFDDEELADEFRALTGEELVEGRLGALATFQRTLPDVSPGRGKVRIELDADEAAAWLAVVNDTRLALGALLGITTESEWEGGPDPDDHASQMLWYLGWLEEGIVAALMGSLEG
jgi:hypothetical protein